MGYFSNSTLNLLNLTKGAEKLVRWAAGVFGALYLYTLGYSLPFIFMCYAAIYFMRFVLRFTLFPIGRFLGIKKTIIVATILHGLAPFILAFAHISPVWVFLYFLIEAWSSALYWTSFHIFYSAASATENRGKQVAAGEAFTVFVAAMIPYASALFITTQGFSAYFWLTIPAVVLCVMPLLFCQDFPDIRFRFTGWKQMFKRCRGAYVQFFQCSALANYELCWPFIVYFSLGDFVDFGEVLTLGLLMQAVMQLSLGHYLDKGHGKIILRTGIGLAIVCIVFMGLSPLNYLWILMLELVYGFAHIKNRLMIVHTVYSDAHNTEDRVMHWVNLETYADMAIMFTLGFGSLLLLWGVQINYVLLLSLIGLVGLYYSIRAYQNETEI